MVAIRLVHFLNTGGRVSLEMAVYLESLGRQVKCVIMLDSYIGDDDKDQDEEDMMDFAREILKNSPNKELNQALIRPLRSESIHNYQMRKAHTPPCYSGNVVLIKAQHQSPLLFDNGWTGTLPNLRVVRTNGNHVSLLGEDNASHISDVINGILKTADIGRIPKSKGILPTTMADIWSRYLVLPSEHIYHDSLINHLGGTEENVANIIAEVRSTLVANILSTQIWNLTFGEMCEMISQQIRHDLKATSESITFKNSVCDEFTFNVSKRAVMAFQQKPVKIIYLDTSRYIDSKDTIDLLVKNMGTLTELRTLSVALEYHQTRKFFSF